VAVVAVAVAVGLGLGGGSCGSGSRCWSVSGLALVSMTRMSLLLGWLSVGSAGRSLMPMGGFFRRNTIMAAPSPGTCAVGGGMK